MSDGMVCEACGVALCHACDTALENCGTCRYSNDEDTVVVPSLHTYCTNANSFYRAKLMEKSARCKAWEPRDAD